MCNKHSRSSSPSFSIGGKVGIMVCGEGNGFPTPLNLSLSIQHQCKPAHAQYPHDHGVDQKTCAADNAGKSESRKGKEDSEEGNSKPLLIASSRFILPSTNIIRW